MSSTRRTAKQLFAEFRASGRSHPVTRFPVHSPHPPRPHPHEERFLDAFELAVKALRITSVEELAEVAERMGEPDAARLLRERASGCSRVDLALELLRAEALVAADRRNGQLLAACENKRVGLLMPLPPHVLDAFLVLEKARILVPHGHALPPHLYYLNEEAAHGNRACRAAAAELDIFVFEGVPQGNSIYFVEPELADVLDKRLLPPEARFVIHRRPHAHPDDVPLFIDNEKLSVL
jgi:hypothetical protein